MIKLHAQPYDISATGFYFESADDYQKKSHNLKNSYGDIVEEFEIQFIDGETIDCELAQAWELNQANFSDYFDAVENWDDEQKKIYIIAVGECSYSHDQIANDPDAIDIMIYQLDSLIELAELFVDEGFYGEIPENLPFYIDYDAIAHDLGFDYSEISIAGKNYVYRCM